MKEFATALANKKSAGSRIYSHKLTETLGIVGHLDNLYVLIHGGSGVIGWKEYTFENVAVPEQFGGGVIKTEVETVHVITPDALVRTMKAAGLSNKHIDLKFMACHGGEAFNGAEATAKLLKDELTKQGLTRISVYGYKGTMDITVSQIQKNPHKQVNLTGKDGDLVRAKENRVKF
jgi:acetylglutamate kinase